MSTLLSERALAVGLRELAANAREIGGDNRGEFCKKYLAYSGLGEGYSWCAAFVSWCYGVAAKELGLTMPFKPTAGAKRLYRAAVSYGGSTAQDLVPPPGSIVCWNRGAPGGGLGHVGMVHHVEGDILYTLEGNHGPRVAIWQHPRLRDVSRLGIAWVPDTKPV